jgi:hypothetical protein
VSAVSELTAPRPLTPDPQQIDRGGVVFRLSREEDITYEPDPELVRKTLKATAGSWADLDLERVIADLYAAREAGSRPPERS